MSDGPYLMRWAGSKRRFADRVRAEFPPNLTEYREPFVGAGCVLLRMIEQGQLAPGADVVVCDVPHVRNLWSVIADRQERIHLFDLLRTVAVLSAEQCGETAAERVFNEAKAALNHPGKTKACRAACVLILNALSFNGLWRVNKSGEFNAPRDKAKVWDPEPIVSRVSRVGALLDRVSFRTVNHWTHSVLWADSDNVYADPPYAETFSSYAPEGFGLADHTALAKCATYPEHCVVSNSDSETTARLYSDKHWRKIYLDRPNSITCNGDDRALSVRELLMVRR